MRSKQAGTVAEEANETARLASRKGPQKRGEHSDFQSRDDTVLVFLGIFMIWPARLLKGLVPKWRAQGARFFVSG